MQKLKYLIIGVIMFCVFGFINVKAEGEYEIYGNSVYRNTESTAIIKFTSNFSGDVFYSVSNNSRIPEEYTQMGTTTASTLKELALDNLSSGELYVHIFVSCIDLDGKYHKSNVLTIQIPYNLYYFDDFESYNENSYPSFLSIKYNGSSTSAQKIINTIDANTNQTKVFRLKGASGWASDSRLSLPPEISGFVVMEVDAKFVSNDAGSISLSQSSGGWVNAIARLIASGGKFKVATGDSGGIDTGVSYSLNTWYNLEIVLNYTDRTFDAFVNNVKINSAPIAAHPTFKIDYLSITSGNVGGGNELYFDNIKFYTTSSLNYPISYNANGGSGTMEADNINNDETFIIPENEFTPATGKIFKEWAIGSIDGERIIPGASKKFYEAKTLYAIWETKTFNISTSVIGGNGDITNNSIVDYGDDKTITFTPNYGYMIDTVKVNDKTVIVNNNKYTLDNITEDKTVVVTYKEAVYDVISGNGQKYTIGKNNDAVFRINANYDLFSKAYLNDLEIDPKFYTVNSGSTIITLKKAFLNKLQPGTYNFKAAFSDGGESITTFSVTKEEINPNTVDKIIDIIILGSISLIGLFGVSIYLKKNRLN